MNSTVKLAAPVIALYIALSLFNYSIIDEDAFIYFRCVDNMLTGNGYAFNPGDPVEACSSLTWYVLLCLTGSMGMNALLASKFLGIVFGCLSIFVVIAITKRFTARMPWLVLPALLMVLTPAFIFKNQMGLETALYCLVFQMLVLISIERPLLRYWPVVAMLLACTRPEGLFLLLGLVGTAYVYKLGVRPVVFGICAMLLLLVVLSVGRLLYFHDFLPNPFYIKVYPDKLKTGLQYIHSFFSQTFLYWFIIPAALLSLLKRFDAKLKILVWYVLVFYAWVLLAGADDKPFYRHCLPGLPLVFLFGTITFENICMRAGLFKKTICAAGLALFACASFLFSTSHELFTFPFRVQVENPVKKNIKTLFSSPGAYFDLVRYRVQEPLASNYIDHSKEVLIGEFIKNNYESGITILYDQMGQTPWMAGMQYRFIDTWGLTDKRIGRYYLSSQTKHSRLLWLYDTVSQQVISTIYPKTVFLENKTEVLDYLFSSDPDIIMFTTLLLYNKEKIIYSLLQDERLNMHYEPRIFLEGWILVFEKKEAAKKIYVLHPDLQNKQGPEMMQELAASGLFNAFITTE